MYDALCIDSRISESVNPLVRKKFIFLCIGKFFTDSPSKNSAAFATYKTTNSLSYTVEIKSSDSRATYHIFTQIKFWLLKLYLVYL